MSIRRLYKSALLVLTGCVVFQATGSCSDQLMSSLVTTLVPAISSTLTTALTGALTNALQNGTAS